MSARSPIPNGIRRMHPIPDPEGQLGHWPGVTPDRGDAFVRQLRIDGQGWRQVMVAWMATTIPARGIRSATTLFGPAPRAASVSARSVAAVESGCRSESVNPFEGGPAAIGAHHRASSSGERGVVVVDGGVAEPLDLRRRHRSACGYRDGHRAKWRRREPTNAATTARTRSA